MKLSKRESQLMSAMIWNMSSCGESVSLQDRKRYLKEIRSRKRTRKDLLVMLKRVVSAYRTFSPSVPRGQQCWTQLDRDTLKAATSMLRRSL